jgi:hypothetical protein
MCSNWISTATASFEARLPELRFASRWLLGFILKSALFIVWLILVSSRNRLYSNVVVSIRKKSQIRTFRLSYV